MLPMHVNPSLETAEKWLIRAVVFLVASIAGVLLIIFAIGRMGDRIVENVIEAPVEVAAAGAGAFLSEIAETQFAVASLQLTATEELPLSMTELVAHPVEGVSTLGVGYRPMTVSASKEFKGYGFAGFNDETVTFTDVPFASIAVQPAEELQVSVASDGVLYVGAPRPKMLGVVIAGSYDFSDDKAIGRRIVDLSPFTEETDIEPIIEELFFNVEDFAFDDQDVLYAAACASRTTVEQLLIQSLYALGLEVEVVFFVDMDGLRTPESFENTCSELASQAESAELTSEQLGELGVGISAETSRENTLLLDAFDDLTFELEEE